MVWFGGGFVFRGRPSPRIWTQTRIASLLVFLVLLVTMVSAILDEPRSVENHFSGTVVVSSILMAGSTRRFLVHMSHLRDHTAWTSRGWIFRLKSGTINFASRPQASWQVSDSRLLQSVDFSMPKADMLQCQGPPRRPKYNTLHGLAIGRRALDALFKHGAGLSLTPYTSHQEHRAEAEFGR